VDTDIAGPYPVVLVVGGLSAQQVATLKGSGYGYIAMNTGSVYSDGANNPHTGAYNQLYPYQAGVYEFDSGALMGWAWGISRIVDAIKNDAAGANQLNLDWRSTAVTGVSRNGKAAALADPTTVQVSYRGAPFLIDSSQHDRVLQLLASDPDFAQFRGRLAAHLARLDVLKVNYRPLDGPDPLSGA